MKITAEPRSDQWNADDFVGGPRTFTIAGVDHGKAEGKYDIELVEGEDRCWRPPLTVLRLLMTAWGDDATVWVGRKVTLYRDPEVSMAGEKVGGIRVSHMSHLPGNKPFADKFTVKRGRRAVLTVQPLEETTDASTAEDWASKVAGCDSIPTLRGWWKGADAETRALIEARVKALEEAALGDAE